MHTQQQCRAALGADSAASPAHLLQVTHVLLCHLSHFAYSSHLQMTQSATCPRTSTSLTPPRPAAHKCAVIHPRPGSAQQADTGEARRPGLQEVGGAGRPGPTGAVTADTEPRVLSANSSRPRVFPKTLRPRWLPSREEASAPPRCEGVTGAPELK